MLCIGVMHADMNSAHNQPAAPTQQPSHPVQVLPQPRDGGLLLAVAVGEVRLRSLQVLVVGRQAAHRVLLHQQLGLGLGRDSSRQDRDRVDTQGTYRVQTSPDLC